jgi:hypothetical protein
MLIVLRSSARGTSRWFLAAVIRVHVKGPSSVCRSMSWPVAEASNEPRAILTQPEVSNPSPKCHKVIRFA